VTGDPVAHRGQRVQHVGARGTVGFADRIAQPAAVPGSGLAQPPPQRRPRQVDGEHLVAPPQQRVHRAHLRAGAEGHHAGAAEVEPVGVGLDRADRLRARRFDDAGGEPGVQAAVDRVAAQALAPVRQGELLLDRAVAAGGGGAERLTGIEGEGFAQRHGRAGHDEPHPVVQRGEAVGGDATGGGAVAEAGLDQAAEVHQVGAAPVGLPLGGARPDRVDRAQGVGDDRPPEGGREAGAARGRREHHARGVRHAVIIPRRAAGRRRQIAITGGLRRGADKGRDRR
jgi:hypothetical protein